jgi:hypothetical protein
MNYYIPGILLKIRIDQKKIISAANQAKKQKTLLISGSI